MNNVTLVGNVTKDPELRYSQAGKGVLHFSIAVNRWSKDDGDQLEGFFDVTAFGTLAENAVESIAKGTRVIVSGKLTMDSWETKDGQKRTAVKIIANEIGPSLRFDTYSKAEKAAVAQDGGF